MQQRVERLRGRRAVEERARYLRLHPLCISCTKHGRLSAAEHVDHVVPLFKGGADDDSNKQALCVPCHKRKTAKDMGWRARVTFGDDGRPVSGDHHWLKGSKTG